jgi:hypothetical protein
MDRAKRLAAQEQLCNDATFTSYSHQGNSKSRVNNRFRDPLRPSCAEGIAHVEHERRLQRLILRLPGKIHPLAAPARLALGAHYSSMRPSGSIQRPKNGRILRHPPMMRSAPAADDIPPLRGARSWALD